MRNMMRWMDLLRSRGGVTAVLFERLNSPPGPRPMSFESVSRWSGMAAMLSGLLWILMLVETASRPAHPERGPFYPLIFLTIGLLAVGLFGIHLRQRECSGPRCQDRK